MRVSKKNAIKAYKAFYEYWKCLEFQYEVGKTYHHKGEVYLCYYGFHACTKPADCLNYKRLDKACHYAEVLCWGTVEKNREGSDTKLVCSNIEIVKELSFEEFLDLINPGGPSNVGRDNIGTNNIGGGNTGSNNKGYGNTASNNKGNLNSGRGNHGDRNTGMINYGAMNSGNVNAGSSNTGDRNYGSENTGHCNCGWNNTGHHNWGCHNTGSWNSGDDCTGYFNTKVPMYMFNKPIKGNRAIKLPSFLYFNVVEWIEFDHMSENEKRLHPEAYTTGGYLKTCDYQEAFRKSFESAKRSSDWPDQLAELKALPNFNYDIFEEISGISKKELES